MEKNKRIDDTILKAIELFYMILDILVSKVEI